MDNCTVVLHDAASRQWLRFRRPLRVLRAQRVEDVIPALKAVEDAVELDHLFAAGWVSYEAAPAFDSALTLKKADSFPLLWFGLFSEPEPLTLPEAEENSAASSLLWNASVTREEYRTAISRIKEYIARGETYQVNFTYRLWADFSLDPWLYFLTLARAQNASYSAYVQTERWTVCSASPELFFRLDGKKIVSLPMKGTAARGLQTRDDLERARWLHRSEKNRAENVMIVDMVRNDMARVADTGSVHVPKLFDVEKYPTVWQMTSTVAASTSAPLTGIFEALFPPASITGAPKARTMSIIAELETQPRRIYTGSIGFMAPGRRAQFNVAIRTVLVDKELRQAEYGVGGGIVWDSTDGSEFEECHTKARILTQRFPVFSLLETILWTPEEGYFLLDYHMDRLKDTAAYFSFAIDMQAVRDALTMTADGFDPSVRKVRLLVDAKGEITVKSQPIVESESLSEPRVCLAPWPVNTSDRFLYHKTTNRSTYSAALAACPGCDDVILWNNKGEVTESSIANLVVSIGGVLYTPPVKCGLLPGTFRAWLLDKGEIRERVISREELQASPEIYLINSVRRMRRVTLVPGDVAS